MELIYPLAQHRRRSNYYDRSIEHLAVVQSGNKGYKLDW